MCTLFISRHAHCHYWSPIANQMNKRRKNKIFPIKMKINGCSLIYIEAEKVAGIKAVSVENWWGIWKRQRKSADTQIHKYKSQTHKYKSQIHKYEDQLMIDEEFGRGRGRVQIHKYKNTNHKYTNMSISWWLMRNLEEAEKGCRGSEGDAFFA